MELFEQCIFDFRDIVKTQNAKPIANVVGVDAHIDPQMKNEELKMKNTKFFEF